MLPKVRKNVFRFSDFLDEILHENPYLIVIHSITWGKIGQKNIYLQEHLAISQHHFQSFYSSAT